MWKFVKRYRWTIGFILAMVIVAYLVVETREISGKATRLTQENAKLTRKVAVQANQLAGQQINTREAQYSGCLRTNERTGETNSKFGNIYKVLLAAAEPSPRITAQIQAKQDQFGGLTMTDCEEEYPPLPGTPPRKK